MSTLAAVAGSGAPARTRRWTLGAAGFTWAVFLACLVAQRFAVPAGGDLKISLATFIVLPLAAWECFQGTLVVERRRMACFLGLVAVAGLSVAVRLNAPPAIAPRMSLTSLAYWLGITAFAVFRFAEPLPARRFYGIVTDCLALIALAGSLQFVGQFAGLTLIEFTGLIPEEFLIEDQYAVVHPLDLGLFRSNGFFLVEPSVFAQFMALGIAVESLTFRRAARLALLFFGLVVAVSGTGWIVLGSFVVALGVGAGLRGLLGAILLVVTTVLAFALLGVALPDIAEGMLSRVTEVGMIGTSGHERFVTPFMALASVTDAVPWAWLSGIGPGASEQLSVPYFYRLNTPLKVLMEYGAGGLILYLGTLLSGYRSRTQWVLTLPAIVLLLFTGGYHQFSPILFTILLLITIARTD